MDRKPAESPVSTSQPVSAGLKVIVALGLGVVSYVVGSEAALCASDVYASPDAGERVAGNEEGGGSGSGSGSST